MDLMGMDSKVMEQLYKLCSARLLYHCWTGVWVLCVIGKCVRSVMPQLYTSYQQE